MDAEIREKTLKSLALETRNKIGTKLSARYRELVNGEFKDLLSKGNFFSRKTGESGRKVVGVLADKDVTVGRLVDELEKLEMFAVIRELYPVDLRKCTRPDHECTTDPPSFLDPPPPPPIPTPQN